MAPGAPMRAGGRCRPSPDPLSMTIALTRDGIPRSGKTNSRTVAALTATRQAANAIRSVRRRPGRAGKRRPITVTPPRHILPTAGRRPAPRIGEVTVYSEVFTARSTSPTVRRDNVTS